MTADAQGIEHDLLGDRPVPAAAYYGVHTLRAVENFPITGTPISIYPDLIRALACIKQAAALANHELGGGTGGADLGQECLRTGIGEEVVIQGATRRDFATRCSDSASPPVEVEGIGWIAAGKRVLDITDREER